MSSPPPVELEVEVGDDSMEEDPAGMMPGDKFLQPSRGDEVLEEWIEKLCRGELSPISFVDHWRVTVPRLYSPQPNRTCLDWSFDEELAHKLLIEPLEFFVWGSKQSCSNPRRSTLCGRVFKQGEPAYSCRECGMDNTCVLCVECFKVSAHRHHKYKMGQSGGGGCCDCGDTEAWKRDPFCELHAAPQNAEDEVQCPEVLLRMKKVAATVLSYCIRLLTYDYTSSLPNDLKMKEEERDPLQILDQPDCYCTILYNDETHTFEQVITTLTRVTKCNHRDSVELVSLIDREGRALVKCSSFQVCDKLKSDIEKFTARHGPSLRVLVMHAHLVAHQIFAMKLLQWLQSFVSLEPALRLAVSKVALGEDDFSGVGAIALSGEGGVAAKVMLNDCRMWKAARAAFHRLLIATTLMDYSTKKSLAVMFTRCYGSMLKDFIRDDHDHAFSISSMSVQLFTTPTLAHHLIAKHDVLYIVLNTFLSECSKHCNNKGRLEFDRNHISMEFKRAQFILYDVKYLLGAVPATFDDELRKGFLHGLTLLLNLLVMMQGMDSVVRQVGQHTEYEPEWEGAFNLHVKLAHGISLALEWCGAERALLAAALRTALARLPALDPAPDPPNPPTPPVRELKELGNQSASVIVYDVTTEPVSIHRPLSRFIAGLFLMMDKFGLTYHSRELTRTDKPKPPPDELIEPVLRTAAMIAQVHAGMWRRNGFALLNQLYFYHNVKCRSEMLDRDVVMLQIGASLIESNEFIIHVLNKFNLLDWASPDFESRGVEDDSLRHTICLVEEFLGLLITIVGSRYVPGVGDVTPEERTKKEIIQMLCVKPMPHSELNKCLPEDQLHETGLEAVIHEVAEFSKPGGAARGLYTLRPALAAQYDTFHYHYTREDLSRSEEAQRTARKAQGLPECCPPPPLPKLTESFRLIANLLQSDAAMHVFKIVFTRALDLRARYFSETQVHKALHLMGYAVRDEESGHYEFLAFCESAERAGVLALLQLLVCSPRVEAHRPLAQWLLNKMRSILGVKEDGAGDNEAMETDQQEKLASNDTDEEKVRRAKLAAERRAKLMAQMQAAQNKFISNNSTLFSTTDTAVTAEEQEVAPLYRGSALGTWGGGVPDPPRTCIMCQEEAPVELKSAPLVLVAFVQESRVLSRSSGGEAGAAWLGAGTRPAPGMAIVPVGAPHVSSCGHALHAACAKHYRDSVRDKENRRPYRLRQPAAFDVEKREFLCPLCERLCNAALPLLPALPAPPGAPPALPPDLYTDSVDIILKNQVCSEAVHECTESCEELHCQARARSEGASSSDMDTGPPPPVHRARAVATLARPLLARSFLAHFEAAPAAPALPDPYQALLHEFIAILPTVVNEDETSSMACIASLCRATSYTVLATNAVLQAENRPLLGDVPARHKDALHALVRVAAVVPTIWPTPNDLAHHAISCLNVLEKYSPLTYTTFGLLVPLVLTAPALFAEASGPARPTHLARQMTLQVFRATLTRAMLVTDVTACNVETMEDDSETHVTNSDLDNLLPIMKELRRGNLNIDELSPTQVWEKIKEQCHSFLRCCCLFFHFLSDINPPTELTVIGGDTWRLMCDYLDLPYTFKELIEAPIAKEKVFEWGSLSDEWFAGNIPPPLVIEPKEPPRLIPLPEDFSELMNIVSEFSCPNSEREDSKYPTMCLVCGLILCSQSYCCQQEIRKGRGGGGTEHAGAAVAHVARCGGGVGVLLRVRECETLLLAAPARGALLPAPYLDLYGETDQGLRRGNPLHLCPERYEQLRMLWLSHGIHERIARTLDSNVLVATQWQHM